MSSLLVVRRALVFLILMSFIALIAVAHAQNMAQAELQFTPSGSAEKNAGVWIDGHYVGYVKELKGAKKVLLLPGIHEIVVRQAWYKEYVEQALFEPGTVHNIHLAMVKITQPTPSTALTAEVRICAIPARAAVFVNDQFAGYAAEFDGAGQAMLITPGQHKLTLALPGYLPFETVLNLRSRQKIKIQTILMKGSVTQAGPLVSHE